MKKIMVAIVSLTLAAAVLSAYETENTPNEAKYYDNAKVIRIKNIEGEGFVQRSYDEGYEEATPNLPVFEKDTVGTTAGRLGIYLGRLNYLRLDSDTLVELQVIPRLRETDLIARVEKGAIYLDIENLDKEKSIEIQTPDCGIFLLDKGVYRINVNENSLTEVYVFEGIAEVAGQESSRNVRENQKIVMARGKIEERPYYFYASEKDDFDRWNEIQNREQGYARYGTSRYLQSGYEDYEYEMSRSGRWSYMSEFNSYVWTPYYSNANWMPYANGRWVYHPFYGYVWTSYDNCGWFTHHYGRWHWDYASGWYWIPAYRWSPAWVSWFWDSEYYGWCPLSWWNRPVIVINNHWDRNYNYHHGIPHHARSTIIIRKNQLTAVNAMRVALSKSNLEQAGAKLIAYRGAAPTERVTFAKVNMIDARGRTVTYKQNSIVSSDKNKSRQDAGQASHADTTKTTTYRTAPAADAASKYSPRSPRGKDSGSSVDSGSEKSYRSKSGGESSSSTQVRSSDSNSNATGSQSKDSARSDSTNSSSTSSDSSREAKKKKDEAAYMALLRSENSAGYKSHAVGSSSDASSSGVAAVSGDSNRFSSRSAGSQSSSNFRSTTADSPTVTSRYSSGKTASPAVSDLSTNRYVSRTVGSANRYATKENTPSQSYSSQGWRSSGFNGTVSSRSYDSNNSSRSFRSTDSGSSSRSSSTTVRSSSADRTSRSSRSSGSTAIRSSGSSRSSSSSSSSSDSRSSKKKN
jgi:hypothetical protein